MARMHLIDQSKKRTAEGNEIRQAVAGEHRGAQPKKIFRLGIGEGDEAFPLNHDDGVADGIDDELRNAAFKGDRGRTHAAFLPAGTVLKTSGISDRTLAGSVSAIRAVRHDRASPPQVSRYHPRCLRAWRNPCPVP